MPVPRPPLRLVPGGPTLGRGREGGPRAPERGQAPERPRSPGAGSAAAGRAALELTGLGTGLVLTFVLMARLPSWAEELGTFQSLYAVAFAFYALALARATRPGEAARAGLVVVAVAAAARLAVLPVTPSLSDDIYRYVWEGRVAAHGGDPYRLSPLDPTLAALRDRDVYPRINHPELATIYPPLSIGGFALVAGLSPTVWAMKLWVVAHDLALVLVLLAWQRARGAGAAPVIAYAWNPLVVVEYAGSGHNDPTALVWLVAALLLAERRPVASALALTAGTLTKLAPLVALPFLLGRWPWRARLVALAGLGVGLGGFWLGTRAADSGLTAYGRYWANNELAFHYLAVWVGDPLAARWIAVGLLAAVLGAAGWRRWEAPRATRLGLRAGLLASPVAHPWYFGWALALEPLGPSGPWLLLSLTAILSYGVLAPPAEGPDFHLPLPWRWVEYGAPAALALSLAVARRLRPRGGAPG